MAEELRVCIALRSQYWYRSLFFKARWPLADLLFVLFLVEVLSDLDLDVAQIALPRNALPFLLLGIRGLLGARGPAFQPAVPVVGDEALALVALRRAVRVDVVDVREVRLEPARSQSLGGAVFSQEGLTRPRSA